MGARVKVVGKAGESWRWRQIDHEGSVAWWCVVLEMSNPVYNVLVTAEFLRRIFLR